MLESLRRLLWPAPRFGSEAATATIDLYVTTILAAAKDQGLAYAVGLKATELEGKGLGEQDLARAALAAAVENGEPVIAVDAERALLFIVEVTVALADAQGVETEAVLHATLRALAPRALLQTLSARGGPAGCLAWHSASVAAVVANGWHRPWVDSVARRPDGWGLLLGNAVAATILEERWPRHLVVLSEGLARLSGLALLDLDTPPDPLPSETPFLPRRHPERWLFQPPRAADPT